MYKSEQTNPAETFRAVNAIVLDPIHPDDIENRRVFCHANASRVWGRRFAN